MATWSSRGLRGSVFEDMINRTNEKYKENHLALIQKIPTPITPIKMDKETRHITLAYFNQKSTVDYIGVVQGIPVCFDAKECAGPADEKASGSTSWTGHGSCRKRRAYWSPIWKCSIKTCLNAAEGQLFDSASVFLYTFLIGSSS